MNKTLRVNVNGKWYYPDNDFIMIELTPEAKDQIHNMLPERNNFAVFPDYLDSDKVDAKMEELKEVGFCPACTLDHPVEAFLRENFLDKLLTDESLERHKKSEKERDESNESFIERATDNMRARLFGFADDEKKVITNVYNILRQFKNRTEVENACMEMETSFDFLEPKTLEEGR